MMILHYLHQIHPPISKIDCLQLVNQYLLVHLTKLYTKIHEYYIKKYVHKIIYKKINVPYLLHMESQSSVSFSVNMAQHKSK